MGSPTALALARVSSTGIVKPEQQTLVRGKM
eukprot:CAMPEP_0194123888 /NCGR_PEP_ID=MMETSP0150-20130528/56392_1 /TAXON_ID=122233 /ORGANISM="Chaetoceros debilis, Strain MM31A-1" /LENGTH=30 /DNA_ID= /DNA_START= /DNA_END= /DNA_ORIENTATION=